MPEEVRVRLAELALELSATGVRSARKFREAVGADSPVVGRHLWMAFQDADETGGLPQETRRRAAAMVDELEELGHRVTSARGGEGGPGLGQGRKPALSEPQEVKLRLEREVLERVDARRGGLSRADWVREALRVRLAQLEEPYPDDR